MFVASLDVWLYEAAISVVVVVLETVELEELPRDVLRRTRLVYLNYPNNPTAVPGIFNVKSGSDASAVDGSKYAEW